MSEMIIGSLVGVVPMTEKNCPANLCIGLPSIHPFEPDHSHNESEPYRSWGSPSGFSGASGNNNWTGR